MAKGFLNTPTSVIIPEIYLSGVTSNAGFRAFTPWGAMVFPSRCVTSFGFLCSMGIPAPSCQPRVNGRPRRGNVERDAVGPCEDRDHVGAYLVCRIPVGGNSVRADYDDVDHTPAHKAPCSILGNQGNRYACPHQFEDRQPGACRKGLVSQEYTLIVGSTSKAALITPSAVP